MVLLNQNYFQYGGDILCYQELGKKTDFPFYGKLLVE